MEKESIPVSGVCELALEVADLDAAEWFYAVVLGFPVVERWSERGEAVWVMAGDRTRVGLSRPQIRSWMRGTSMPRLQRVLQCATC